MNKDFNNYILEVINNQIKNNNPKCTKEAFIKLQNLGFSKKEGKKILVEILFDEIEKMLEEKEEFNEKRYEQRLLDGLSFVEEYTSRINNYVEHPEDIKLYDIKVSLHGYKSKLHRTFQIPAISTVSELAYTILILMRATEGHLYYIEYDGIKFKNFTDDSDEEFYDPSTMLLDELELEVGSKLTMIYDFGEDWRFDIKVLNINKIKQDEKYPKLISGKGYGILEDARWVLEYKMENGHFPPDVDELAFLPEDYEFDVEKYQNYIIEEMGLIGGNYVFESNDL